MSEADYFSHTHTHPFLPVSDDDELEFELRHSAELISERTGIKPQFLAYPMGGYDSRVMDVAKRYYDAAFSVENKMVDLTKLNEDPDYRYRIPRITVTATDPHEVYLQLNGLHELLIRVFGKLLGIGNQISIEQDSR